MEFPRPLTAREYNEVISSKADTILLSAAFGLENTRSELAVSKRKKYSALVSKRQSGLSLTASEIGEELQLKMCVSEDGAD